MKQKFLFFILLLITSFVYSQSTEWKQIDTPYKNSIKLLYQSNEGILFGVMNETSELLYSIDNGINWIDIKEVEFDKFNYEYGITFKEDISNNIFYFVYNKVYKFNRSSYIFELVLTNSFNIKIFDIGILINNNIVLANEKGLFLYTPNGQLLEHHHTLYDRAKILLGRENGSKNLLINGGSLKEIWEFSPDLSFIGNKIVKNLFEIYRSKNRLISINKYSDDGGNTWNEFDFLKSKLIRSIYVCNKQYIYYSTDKELIITTDGGNSFSSISHEFGIIDYFSLDLKNVLFVAFEINCAYKIFKSTDMGLTWSAINNEVGNHYALKIFPGDNENLFTYHCILQNKKGSNSNWEQVVIGNSPLLNSGLTHIDHLSDNSIITSSSNKLYKFNKEQGSWYSLDDKLYDNFWFHSITEKDKRLFHLNQDSLYYSDDMGSSWKGISTGLIQPNLFLVRFDFSKDFDIYYNDNVNFNNIICYNFNTQYLQPFNLQSENENQIEFLSSFKGDRVFVLSVENSTDRLLLHTTIDRGKTFTSKVIGLYDDKQIYRLKIDHLGNIYLFTRTNLKMSSDQGDTWVDITPDFPELVYINDLQVSYDNFIYLATTGMGILKHKTQLSMPNELKVFVFDDLNNNCIRDANELPIRTSKVIVNGNYLSQVDKNGEASFYLHNKDNVVTLEFNDEIYSSCESFYNINFDGTTSVMTLDIPLKAKRYCADIKSGISTPFLRRCFDNNYYGSICNEGSFKAENVELKIRLDEFFNVVSVNLPIISLNGSELILNAGTIEAGDCTNLALKISLNCNANLGMEHCIELNIQTSGKECEEINMKESTVDCQTNFGSFDPNDKSIFINGVRGQAYIEPGDKLEYMIRFQNTGTDTAFTVKILDPISSKFDITSIRPVASSHEYEWSIENGILKVVFNNIMLVDSFKNETNSHGFIKFEITLDKETKLNEEVSNSAGIYFDFNDAVNTNTVITPVGKPDSSLDLVSDRVDIFPNPTSDFITIKVKDPGFANAKTTIYNSTGTIVLSDYMTTSALKLDVSQLLGGYYLVSVVSEAGEYKVGFVKI